MRYCESIFETRRFRTREVKVGNIGIGGDNPIRMQSMTTSPTRDVEATVEQVIRLADAGCEIVRVTVQGIKEADACEGIKNLLIQKGYDIPLVADIHFFPPAAMRVVDFVDKVRVNPGNFVDKRATFKTLEYDDETYAQELLKIEEKFSPLVLKCKDLGRAMRIGTNHGSLSDRIMNRYGDSPRGMVESALEFARVCRKHDFHDFVFSMKASNPIVMIQAYRMLVAEMLQLGWDYPLHLGVTEAGDGEDGRVKSAMGIGALLLDGLGDTIRVSLTEDPWLEIDPCRRLLEVANAAEGKGIHPFEEKHRDFTNIVRRPSQTEGTLLHRDGSVLLDLSHQSLSEEALSLENGKKGIATPDAVIATGMAPEDVQRLLDLEIGVITEDPVPGATRLVSLENAAAELRMKEKTERFTVALGESKQPTAISVTEEDPSLWPALHTLKPAFILLDNYASRLHGCRRFFDWLQEEKLEIPVILDFRYRDEWDDLVIAVSAEAGALLCDGLGDGLLIQGPHPVNDLRALAFNILQGARRRTTKTEFVSCPSCGRTLFDLQDTTQRIRSKTAHLPGVSIAIMGCIVNGPGEMADADFGYVGSRAGMVDLYVGKECVEKNIPFEEADDRLIDLIKRHDRWVEPSAVEAMA